MPEERCGCGEERELWLEGAFLVRGMEGFARLVDKMLKDKKCCMTMFVTALL